MSVAPALIADHVARRARNGHGCRRRIGKTYGVRRGRLVAAVALIGRGTSPYIVATKGHGQSPAGKRARGLHAMRPDARVGSRIGHWRGCAGNERAVHLRLV